MAATTVERALLLAVAATTAVVLLLHPTTAGAARPSAAPRESSYTEFIRRSCSSTLYTSLCYNSLVGYASVVDEDPIKLACVANNVSLAHVRSVSSHVSFLRRTADPGKVGAGTVSALEDCEDNLGDAIDLTRQAATQLRLLPSAKSTEVAWRVSNAQTWMSAALTNEDTCVDGFDEVASGAARSAGSAVKADVCGRVRLAERYTSNALALVNRLVGTNR